MGSCLSKKKDSSSSSVADATVTVKSPGPVPAPEKVDPKKCDNPQNQKALPKQETTEELKEEEGLVKKEVVVIKHRKSHDKRAIPLQNEEIAVVNAAETEKEKEETGNTIGNGVVRTSSCTKEEVDEILIQCGRLSRSNSSGKTSSSARKYSGSKRSYDFDQNEGGGRFERDGGDDNSGDVMKKKASDEEEPISSQRQHRQRHRQSGRQSPVSRRRTPSRERDQQQHSQQRSGSRERGSGGSSGRRVSRSPGRRSENNNAATTANACGNSANANNRPGKMVSVPATVDVDSMTAANSSGVKRMSVKRNAGEANGAVGSRTAASPPSKSPARVNAKEQQQQPSLSRSSSRKADHSPHRRNPSSENDPNCTRKSEQHSPFRRNPLSEIDPNSLQYPPSAACTNKALNVNSNRVRNKSRDFEGECVLANASSINVLYQAQSQVPNAEIVSQGTNHKTSCRGTTMKVAGVNTIDKEHLQIPEEINTQLPMTGSVVVTESQKPHTVTRTRSSRLSRDVDLNPETLLNPTPSYTALLLEDIQNFHQKSTPAVSLPACVTKACSILEAVADLNTTTSSNLSGTYSEDRKAPSGEQSNSTIASFSARVNLVGKKMTEAKDPFVESEVFADDDLMEPSFHRYVTVRRGGGGLGGVDMDGQESSGSNSFVGSSSHQNWNLSSSSWEPNSADSTDRWTSKSNTEADEKSPLGFQRHAVSEAADSDAGKNRKGKRRDTNCQQNGFRRGRVAASS